jgi:hypothetical protein
MPTAARLVAAILLALLAYVLSELVRPLMPEGTPFGSFNFINAFIGLCVGWVVMGPRAGRGTVPGINNGLTGTAVLFVWALGFHAATEMFRQAMRNRYDGPIEAVTAIFLIASEFGVKIAVPSVLLSALAGAIIVGIAVEFAARRWR